MQIATVGTYPVGLGTVIALIVLILGVLGLLTIIPASPAVVFSLIVALAVARLV